MKLRGWDLHPRQPLPACSCRGEPCSRQDSAAREGQGSVRAVDTGTANMDTDWRSNAVSRQRPGLSAPPDGRRGRWWWGEGGVFGLEVLFHGVSQTVFPNKHFQLYSQSKHSLHSGDLCFNVNTAFVSIRGERGRLRIALLRGGDAGNSACVWGG